MKIYVIAFWRKRSGQPESDPRWHYLMPKLKGAHTTAVLAQGPSLHIGNAKVYHKRKEAVADKKTILKELKEWVPTSRRAVGKPVIIEVGGHIKKFT